MKTTIKILSLLFITFIISSCDKGEEMKTLPKNSINGDFLYQSSSKYYKSDGQFDRTVKSSGSIFIKANSSNSLINLEIKPIYGYIYNIKCTNIQQHGDTTTFSISRQEVHIDDQSFSVEGTKGINVGRFGMHDGYYISNKVYLQYRSINTTSFALTKTYIEATKGN